MKKNFFKFLLLGALTFAVGAGFVGCKDYDDDIKDLQDQINDLKNHDHSYVSSVSYANGVLTVTGGAAAGSYNIPNLSNLTVETTEEDGTVTVTLKNGSTVISSSEFDLPAGGGDAWDPAKLTIGEDGVVEYDGEATGVTIPEAAEGAVVTVTTANGEIVSYTITDPASGLSVTLPVAAAAARELAAIDILGWGKVGAEVSKATLVEDIAVDWAWIGKFTLDTDNKGAGGNTAGTADPSWNAQEDVKAHQVLTSLAALGDVIFVQVSPSDADLTTLDFQLVSSKEDAEALPLVLGTPEPFTGLLTKAGSANALWTIPVLYTNGVEYPTANDFGKQFEDVAKTVYALVETTTGFVSYYGGAVTKNAALAAGVEQPVATLIPDGDKTKAITGTGAPTKFLIQTGVDYSLTFANQNAAANLVVDYYVEAADDYEAEGFQFVPGRTTGTFKVTADPDVFTPATMTLNVYKLNITGAIYFEQIQVQPTLQGSEHTFEVEKYVITDDVAALEDSLSGPITLDLNDMFTKLGEDFTKHWQSATYGANTEMLVSLTYSDGTDKPATELLNSIAVGGSSKIEWLDGAGANASTKLYTAKTLKITPVYRTNAPADNTATFVVDKKYTATFNVLDKDGIVINTIKVVFTPTIPNPDGLIVKNDPFWVDGVLNAYYKVPTIVPADTVTFTGTNAAGLKDQAAIYGLVPGQGFGAFISLGGTPGTDKEWAKFAFGLDPKQKIGDKEVVAYPLVGYVSGTTPVDSMNVALYGQNTDGHYTASGTSGVVLPGEEQFAGKAYNPYKQELNILLDKANAKYLGVYAYPDAQLAMANFKMKVMSALFEGGIKVTKPLEAKAGAIAGQIITLSKDNISGYNYANESYSLFPIVPTTPVGVTGGVYDYGYVKSVTFARPAAGTDVYEFLDDAGVALVDQTKAVATAPDKKTFALRIKVIGQISKDATIPVEVTVTDRFGKVKKETVNLTISFPAE